MKNKPLFDMDDLYSLIISRAPLHMEHPCGKIEKLQDLPVPVQFHHLRRADITSHVTIIEYYLENSNCADCRDI